MTLLEHKPGASPAEIELEERKVIGLRKKHRGNLWMAREEVCTNLANVKFVFLKDGPFS